MFLAGCNYGGELGAKIASALELLLLRMEPCNSVCSSFAESNVPYGITRQPSVFVSPPLLLKGVPQALKAGLFKVVYTRGATHK